MFCAPQALQALECAGETDWSKSLIFHLVSCRLRCFLSTHTPLSIDWVDPPTYVLPTFASPACYAVRFGWCRAAASYLTVVVDIFTFRDHFVGWIAGIHQNTPTIYQLSSLILPFVSAPSQAILTKHELLLWSWWVSFTALSRISHLPTASAHTAQPYSPYHHIATSTHLASHRASQSIWSLWPAGQIVCFSNVIVFFGLYQTLATRSAWWSVRRAQASPN